MGKYFYGWKQRVLPWKISMVEERIKIGKKNASGCINNPS
jgi:hypothetical protein